MESVGVAGRGGMPREDSPGVNGPLLSGKIQMDAQGLLN
jgi:hypothetical protein